MAKAKRTAVLGRPKTPTSVSLPLAFLVGVAIAAVIYLAAYSLKEFPDIPVYVYLFERGWFQYVSTIAFGVAIAILLLKTDRIKAEKAAFSVVDERVFANHAGKSALPLDQMALVKRSIESLEPEVRKTMLGSRLENASRRLQNTRSAAEVDNIFQILSDGDANMVASSYTTVRFLIALIPLLGFLGNVYGVGQGIGRFSEVLNQAQSFDSVRPALQFAAFKLAIAFDATFLALFYSAIILFFHALVEQREEGLLAAVDEYCIDRFISRIHIVSADIAELKEIMTSLASDAIDALSQVGQRVDLGREAVVTAVGENATAVTRSISEVKALVGNTGQDGVSAIADIVREILELVDQSGQRANLGVGMLASMKEKLDQLALSKDAPSAGPGLEVMVKTLERVVAQLSSIGAAAEGLKAVANMTGMLADLQKTLDALKPAIDSMSAEMAKEVNHVLSQLLRVMVVANRAATWRAEELQEVRDPNLLNRIFGNAGV